MAEETPETEAIPEPSGGKKKIIILGAGGIVLIAIGVFAGPLVMNMISPAEETADASDAAAAEVAKEPAIYQSLHPPLVVNFKDMYGDPHFMQITMEVMSRDQDVVNAIRDHTPAIRNALILMFGGSVYEQVVTREGKEQMLKDALREIQDVVTEQVGKDGVEEVYFTSLVIQ